MPLLTRVPQVLERLVELMVQACPAARVLDGPIVGQVMSDDVLCVGLSDAQDEPGYSAQVERMEGLGRPRYVEEWSVATMLVVSSGEANGIADLRVRAGGMLEAIDDLVRDASVEDGVWQSAGLGPRMSWLPVQDESGSALMVFFVVMGRSAL